MPKPNCPDEEFVTIFEQCGAAETAKRLNIGIRSVYDRRVNLEKSLGRQITAPGGPRVTNITRHGITHPHRVELNVKNGIVLIGSDAHIWPGPVSPAMKAFIKFCKEMSPAAVIMNGDVMDFATISRHPPIGWEKRPTVQEEIEAAQAIMHRIELAVPKSCELSWPLGNHDARLETRLATVAPEYARVHGVHLRDHFGPRWRPCWATWINNSVVIKHRHKGGIHATHNSTMWSGKTMVTGHLHSLKVTPFSDYNGTRWGVDTGTLADPDGAQFRDYSEDNPKNHRSGFVVLTFKDGRLLWPEVVAVHDAETIDFRGQLVRI
jgi:hypothetical protein